MKLSQSDSFEMFWDSSNEQSLLQSSLYLAFYQNKIQQKYNV